MNKKIKILIGTIITILTCCIFLITSHAQEGYQINENGNIESLNQININDYYSERVSIDINENELKILVNNNVWAYVEYKIRPNTQYTISFNSNNTGKVVYSDNGNSLYNIDFSNGHFTRTFTSDNNYLRFYIAWGSAETKTTILNNIMLNEGSSELEYFPYGLYTGSNNPIWNNVENFEFAYNFNYQNYNTENVYKYISPNYWDFEGLLNSINIESNSFYAYDNYLNITFKDPINISNFKYILTGPLARMIDTQNYYITLGEKNNQNNIAVPFNTSGARYEIEIPNNFMLKAIDMHWVNTDQEKSWPNTMNAREYDIGYKNGYNDGYKTSAESNYNNGYANGLKYGLNEGEIRGINRANSTINTTSASYVEGFTRGEQSRNNLTGMVFAIVESPINIFKQIFDFNVLGFDITQVIFSLISLLLIVFLIKKLIK